MNEHSFEGRVAVVTGAGRGIGRAYALLLADRGAQRRRQRPRRLDGGRRAPTPGRPSTVAAEIVAAGGVAIADTQRRRRRRPAPQALVDAAVEQFGRIDILVNNAGIIRWAGLPGRRRRQPRARTSRCTSAARSTPRAPRGRTWSSRATAAS